MPTFLVNPKMPAALAARIEASLRGATGRPAPSRGGPSRVAVLRLALLLIIVGAVGMVVVLARRSRQELDFAQREVLGKVQLATAQLSPAAKTFSAASRASLQFAAMDYPGDLFDADVKQADSLKALLERPAVYVRGPLEAFALSSKIEKAAAESLLDAFPFCFVEPPAANSESAIRKRVDAMYGVETVGEVRRLYDGFLALAYLAPSWSRQVREATTTEEVEIFRGRWLKAKVETKVLATRAELLIYVLDEPKKPGTVAELDGASDHMTRVGVVELGTQRPLLRVRRHQDPSWISEAKRARFASLYDGCRLAYDIRQELAQGTSPPP